MRQATGVIRLNQDEVKLHTRTARVSKRRQRFGKYRIAGLSDAARPGEPAKYDEPPPKGDSQWNGSRVAERLGDMSKDQVWLILPLPARSY